MRGRHGQQHERFAFTHVDPASCAVMRVWGVVGRDEYPPAHGGGPIFEPQVALDDVAMRATHADLDPDLVLALSVAPLWLTPWLLYSELMPRPTISRSPHTTRRYSGGARSRRAAIG